jgi:thiamine pyrophosphate-dependent acetolactate synthase large subunit-like protein
MRIDDYVKYIAEVIPEDALVVSSHTNNTRAWAAVGRPEGSLMGFNMGLATPVGIGLALALPHRRVIILDSDGGALLLTSGVMDLASQQPPNVIVVIHDNESTIGIPSHTAKRADLALIAKGAGIENACAVRTLEEFKIEFAKALKAKSTSYIVAKAEMAELPPPVGVNKPFLEENTFSFVRFIERREGVSILGSGWRG